jgi:hypothetical protein
LDQFVTELGNVPVKFQIWNKAELVSGFISKLSRKASRKNENLRAALSLIRQAVNDIQKRYIKSCHRFFLVWTRDFFLMKNWSGNPFLRRQHGIE